MADDLDDNYLIEKDLSPANEETLDSERSPLDKLKKDGVKKKPKSELDSIAKESSTHSEKSNSNKKKKKMNITELISREGSKLNSWLYIKNEFKKALLKYINDNLSSVEKNDLNLTMHGNDASSIEKRLNKMLLKLSKKNNKKRNLSFAKKFKLKFNKKLQLLKQKEKNNKQDNKQPSPSIIILCSSAIRCIQVEKLLGDKIDLIKSKKIRWMHAFAKHKNLQKQIEFIKSTSHLAHQSPIHESPIQLIYATPKRLLDLIKADCFNLNYLKHVVIDYTFRDCKLKRFFDMPDIKNDFFHLFFEIFMKYNKDKIQIKFFLS